MNTYVVYKLIEKSNNNVIYVGSTKYFYSRITTHLRDCYEKNRGTKLCNYIRQVCNKEDFEKYFEFVKILENRTALEAAHGEYFWYSIFKKQGNLLNEKIPKNYSTAVASDVPRILDNGLLLCRNCGETKEPTEFHIKNSVGSGHQSFCKDCQCHIVNELRVQKEFDAIPGIEKLKEVLPNIKPILSKVCTKCNCKKHITNFAMRYKETKTGFYSWCKECVNKQTKEKKDKIKVVKSVLCSC